MASEAAHLKKAQQNKDFLATLNDAFPDWLAVVAFYAAVHYVEAFFARSGIHSKKHEERNRRLKEHHPDIWAEFKPLHDASRLVRYTERCITTNDARNNLIAKRLAAVERLVTTKLAAAPAPTAPVRATPRRPGKS